MKHFYWRINLWKWRIFFLSFFFRRSYVAIIKDDSLSSAQYCSNNKHILSWLISMDRWRSEINSSSTKVHRNRGNTTGHIENVRIDLSIPLSWAFTVKNFASFLCSFLRCMLKVRRRVDTTFKVICERRRARLESSGYLQGYKTLDSGSWGGKE